MDLQNWRIQLRKGLLELAVLNLLSVSKRHGYEMVQFLRQFDGFEIHEGNIYPILARLQMDGIIQGKKEPSPDGPARKYYHLTKKGKDILVQMDEQWETFVRNFQIIRRGPSK